MERNGKKRKAKERKMRERKGNNGSKRNGRKGKVEDTKLWESKVRIKPRRNLTGPKQNTVSKKIAIGESLVRVSKKDYGDSFSVNGIDCKDIPLSVFPYN